jgi:hypothetical protein
MGGASIKYYSHVTFAARKGSSMFAEQGGRSIRHADVPRTQHGLYALGEQNYTIRVRVRNILEGCDEEARRVGGL